MVRECVGKLCVWKRTHKTWDIEQKRGLYLKFVRSRRRVQLAPRWPRITLWEHRYMLYESLSGHYRPLPWQRWGQMIVSLRFCKYQIFCTYERTLWVTLRALAGHVEALGCACRSLGTLNTARIASRSLWKATLASEVNFVHFQNCVIFHIFWPHVCHHRGLFFHTWKQ